MSRLWKGANYNLTPVVFFFSLFFMCTNKMKWTFLGWKNPYVNTYNTMGKFSRRQIGDSFLIFSRKQHLTFHANCLLRRQFAWNVKSFFFWGGGGGGKIRKIIQNVVCWNFTLHAVRQPMQFLFFSSLHIIFVCLFDVAGLGGVDRAAIVFYACAGLGRSVGCASEWRSGIRGFDPRRFQQHSTVLRDWSWNIFYSHSLPSADPRRTLVSFWQHNVHKYSFPGKVWTGKLTALDMTLMGWLGRKSATQTNHTSPKI